MANQSLSDTKAELRVRARSLISKISRERHLEAQYRIEALYQQLPEGAGIASFISLPDEPDTSALNQLLGVRLWLPQGAPGFAASEGAPPLQLILVPGLMMSTCGHRLGRGAGWYDRALAAYPDMATWGICWRELAADSLPTEAHDVLLQRVIFI